MKPNQNFKSIPVTKKRKSLKKKLPKQKVTEPVRQSRRLIEQKANLELISNNNLTLSMLSKVKNVWRQKVPDKEMVINFGYQIKQCDLATLEDLNWLNGNIINFYMNLIVERSKQPKYSSVYAMNTFFYPKLKKDRFQSLSTWTKNVNIFEHTFLIVPIHTGEHWCVVIIDLDKNIMRYYDSMGRYNRQCLTLLLNYLKDEMWDKKKKRFDTKGWKLENAKDIPLQENASDCGVFVCMFVNRITARKKITFSQKNMPCFRHNMVYEILHSELF